MLDEEPNLNNDALLSEMFANECPLTDEDRLELWRRRRECSPGQIIHIRSTDVDKGPGLAVGLVWMALGIASWEVLRLGWRYLWQIL